MSGAPFVSKRPWTTDCGPRRAVVLDAEGRMVMSANANRPLIQQRADLAMASAAPDMAALINPTLYALTDAIDRIDTHDLHALAEAMRLRNAWTGVLMKALVPDFAAPADEPHALPRLIFRQG